MISGRPGPAAVTRLRPEDWLATGYLAVAAMAVAFVRCPRARCQSRRSLYRRGPVASAAAGLLIGAPLPRPLVWAGMAVVVTGPATVTVSVTYRGQTATGTFVIDVQ